jgi:DNA-binding response OmpR family regulator
MNNIFSSTPTHGVPSDAALILVADDSLDCAKTLSWFLHYEGHKVITANDGVHALRLVQDLRPEVVLLDISMPGLSGHEVAREIRKIADYRPLLIAVTALDSEEDVLQSLCSGFDHHLVKSPNLSEMRRILEEFKVGRRAAV